MEKNFLLMVALTPLMLQLPEYCQAHGMMRSWFGNRRPLYPRLYAGFSGMRPTIFRQPLVGARYRDFRRTNAYLSPHRRFGRRNNINNIHGNDLSEPTTQVLVNLPTSLVRHPNFKLDNIPDYLASGVFRPNNLHDDFFLNPYNPIQGTFTSQAIPQPFQNTINPTNLVGLGNSVNQNGLLGISNDFNNGDYNYDDSLHIPLSRGNGFNGQTGVLGNNLLGG